MSRSYKKYPSCKCEISCKYGKRLSNKKFRKHTEHFPKGNYHKKIYDSYDVCDYKFTDFTNSINYAKYKRK